MIAAISETTTVAWPENFKINNGRHIFIIDISKMDTDSPATEEKVYKVTLKLLESLLEETPELIDSLGYFPKGMGIFAANKLKALYVNDFLYEQLEPQSAHRVTYYIQQDQEPFAIDSQGFDRCTLDEESYREILHIGTEALSIKLGLRSGADQESCRMQSLEHSEYFFMEDKMDDLERQTETAPTASPHEVRFFYEKGEVLEGTFAFYMGCPRRTIIDEDNRCPTLCLVSLNGGVREDLNRLAVGRQIVFIRFESGICTQICCAEDLHDYIKSFSHYYLELEHLSGVLARKPDIFSWNRNEYDKMLNEHCIADRGNKCSIS